MTPEQVKELISQGESLALEFKGEEKEPLSDRDLVETAVCLANRPGSEPGWILVGVEDDGRVTGVRPRHGSSTDPIRIQALIANRTRPSLTCRATVVELEGKPVLAIEVPPSPMPVGTTDGRYLRRAIGGTGRPECLPYHFHEMQAALAGRGALDYSALVVPEARWEDLDPLEFERFRRMIRESRGQGDRTLLDLPDLELANALIHRDYTRMGGVHIQWHDDRIEISNPGGFPEGVHLGNLLVAPPRPRNPLLADAFKRAGIVERTARGIDTIFYEQLRNGRPAPSYERSTSTDVVLVLPGGRANLAFVRLIVEEGQADRPLGLDELLLLNRLWQERRLATPEASRLVQKSEAEARGVLESLVERGLVEARGAGRGRAYHLSAATYRRLGEEAAYVRLKGFERPQMEQMILEYAKAHGRITRREAAELCRLKEYQAFYILQKLEKAGRLEAVGKGRGAYYRPAETNA